MSLYTDHYNVKNPEYKIEEDTQPLTSNKYCLYKKGYGQYSMKKSWLLLGMFETIDLAKDFIKKDIERIRELTRKKNQALFFDKEGNIL